MKAKLIAKKKILTKDDLEAEVLSAINAMQPADKKLAQKIHSLVKANAPELESKTWYGMPAYANKEGKIICFFQSAQKFNTRYATLGFMHEAHLDDGNMWPVSYALKKITASDEKKIAALIRQAVE